MALIENPFFACTLGGASHYLADRRIIFDHWEEESQKCWRVAPQGTQTEMDFSNSSSSSGSDDEFVLLLNNNKKKDDVIGYIFVIAVTFIKKFSILRYKQQQALIQSH